MISRSTLAEKTGPELVALYNELAETPVKRFPDRKTGVRRVLAAAEAAGVLAPEEPGQEEPAAPPARRGRKAQGEAAVPAADPKTALAAEGPGAGGRRKLIHYVPTKAVRPPRTGTKRAVLLAMLQRPEGATFAEIEERIGWSRRDAADAVRLCATAHGYVVAQREDGRVFAAEPEPVR